MNISPSGPRPRPKFKGKIKRPAAPKIKAGPRVKPLDVFKAALSADAGADSHTKIKYKEDIHKLSKAEMSNLQKMIKQMTKKAFPTDRERRKHMAACNKIREAIRDRSEQATEAEILLDLMIKQKLEQIPIAEVERPKKGPIISIKIENEWLPIKQFVQQSFAEEIELVKQAFDQGTLIHQHITDEPQTFVEDVIQNYL